MTEIKYQHTSVPKRTANVRQDVHSNLLHQRENIAQKAIYYKVNIPRMKDDHSAVFEASLHTVLMWRLPKMRLQDERLSRQVYVAVSWYASQIRFLFADSE